MQQPASNPTNKQPDQVRALIPNLVHAFERTPSEHSAHALKTWRQARLPKEASRCWEAHSETRTKGEAHSGLIERDEAGAWGGGKLPMQAQRHTCHRARPPDRLPAQTNRSSISPRLPIHPPICPPTAHPQAHRCPTQPQIPSPPSPPNSFPNSPCQHARRPLSHPAPSTAQPRAPSDAKALRYNTRVVPDLPRPTTFHPEPMTSTSLCEVRPPQRSSEMLPRTPGSRGRAVHRARWTH